MKKYKARLAIVVSVLLLGLMVYSFQGQTPSSSSYTTGVTRNKTVYYNSAIDTAPQPSTAGVSTGYIIGPYPYVTLRVYITDSSSAVYHFDYRANGNSAWTTATATSQDTITSVKWPIATASHYFNIVLRDATTDRIPGVSTQFRIRAAWAASGNKPDSTGTHTDRLEY